MKKSIVIAAALTAMSVPALAQSYQSQQIGNYTHYTGPNGYEGTSTQTGDLSSYRDNRGNQCTTRRVGNLVNTVCN